MGLHRTILVSLSVLLLTLPANASPRETSREPDAARGHRHLVRVPIKDAASIDGHVVDASTGAPVFQATVSAQGASVTAAADGSFVLDQLVPGATTVTIRRWGYVDTTKSLTLVAGSNSTTITMQSKPPAVMVNAAGETKKFDASTAHFAQEVLFVGYRALEPLEVCLTNGTLQNIATADMKTVTGTGETTSNSVCCPNAASPKLRFVLRDNSLVDAILEECKFYRIDFVGHDYATGQWIYIRSTDIRSITFP